MLIDSHCHIHDTEFFDSAESERVYQRARDAKIAVCVIGTTERDSKQAIEFARTRAAAWAFVGVHPHEALHGADGIERIVRESRQDVTGIGEIGLDYFYENSPRKDQIRILEQQLQLAVDTSLPVSFHVRDAFDDFWPIFDNFSHVQGVLHSFTDSIENLHKGLSRGLYIGVNGISTFTKRADQRDMFASIPLDKMVLETDSPFLTPKQLRGKINEPVNVRLVAEHVAAVHHVTYDDVARLTSENVTRVFSLHNV